MQAVAVASHGLARRNFGDATLRNKGAALHAVVSTSVRYGKKLMRRLSSEPSWRNLQKLLGRAAYERLRFEQYQGYWPHLRRPRTFSEKVAHRKLFDAKPLYSALADKWAVRDYVRERCGDELLNDAYCLIDDPDDLRLGGLPDRFVLKATHGSDMNIIVDNKAGADPRNIRQNCKAFLAAEYGRFSNEFHYLSIPRRILAERHLGTDDQPIPLDFKFFVFHGRCEYIQVDFDRFTNHTRRFYNRDWQSQPFTLGYPIGPTIDAPENLAEMLAIAERLGSGLDFARVDLYSIGDRIVFGEITIAPEAGWAPFGPTRDYDTHLGTLW
jgi:hypothetical protein